MRPVTRTLSRLAQTVSPGPLIPISQRAAQYVRMSTDHQRYSIDNQSAVIAAYAAIHDYTIVHTYTDAGRSGLRAEGRDALLQLVDDVKSARADFGTILVYDISRWGRFQDADEAAYYEFICRNAGVNVRYCAEQFENDGSLVTTIVKGMKRAMAAEFSRELSFKVLEGQKRLAGLGFHRGGTPGYGLRRLLVDENGKPKVILGFKQEKNLQTDRVILMPGPPDEVSAVRDIFRMFVVEHTPPTHIANRLNERGIPNAWGNPWTANNIFNLLKNESYVGTLVYNRTTQKLLSKRRPNPKSVWIKKQVDFKGIIDLELFEAAQKIFKNSWIYSDNELLDYLTATMCVHGRLTSRIIRERQYGPSIATYYHRFGKISEAFRAVGYRRFRIVGDPLYKSKPKRRRHNAPTPSTHSQFRYRL